MMGERERGGGRALARDDLRFLEMIWSLIPSIGALALAYMLEGEESTKKKGLGSSLGA
jgi:hypothetical protein